jgi:flagellar basal body L-ring protein FlgH
MSHNCGREVIVVRHPRVARWTGAGLMLAAMAALGGCASGPPESAADSAIAVAGTEINQARQDGALASASVSVQEAQQKLLAAQQARSNGDTAAAIRLADEAKADADLADTTARAAHEEQAAAAVRNDAGALRQMTSPNP